MELILTNKDGQELDLLNNDQHFTLTSCESLHGIETDIATAEAPYIDGVIIENVKALPRGIILTFAVKPDIATNIDFFTSIVKSKQYVTLTQRENGKEIKIKGVATIPPYTRMLALCKIQLSIYCGQPYWEDLNETTQTISVYLSLLNFPIEKGQYFTRVDGLFGGRPISSFNLDKQKTFINNGDVEVGINIKIVAISSVTNPRISCSTGNQNGWYMQLNLTLNANDIVEINTVKGQKYITINGSEEYNGQPTISYLTFRGNDWLQLETGANVFSK